MWKKWAGKKCLKIAGVTSKRGAENWEVGDCLLQTWSRIFVIEILILNFESVSFLFMWKLEIEYLKCGFIKDFFIANFENILSFYF